MNGKTPATNASRKQETRNRPLGAAFVGLLAMLPPVVCAAEAPVFELQELFEGRGGRNILVAVDGTVLAFHNQLVRRSSDAGRTWEPPREIGPGAGGNALVDETSGDILLVRPDRGSLWRSKDHGLTWTHEEITVLPNGFGHGAPDGVPANAGAMQPGITLQFGEHKGRLLMPARCQPPMGNNEVRWWPYNYNTAVYSDDGGKTWQTSTPFPVLGTGEGTLAELSDGRVYYNSREHMSRGNRFVAWSHDGGATWLNPFRCQFLPDGMRGDRYGCMGGLVRLPLDDRDVLIYSNLDSEGGEFRGRGRQKITVWASLDGAQTWPLKRRVYDGPSAYSSLAAGRPGTPSEGLIYLLFEGGPTNMYAGVLVARFHLSWILGEGDSRRN
jgi:sialidase-1